jgi:hypothetical protein
MACGGGTEQMADVDDLPPMTAAASADPGKPPHDGVRH